MTLIRLLSIASLLLLLFGCAVRGVVVNDPMTLSDSKQGDCLHTFQLKWEADRNALMLAFSGSGTRAAALSYGVLKELRDTTMSTDGGDKHLLKLDGIQDPPEQLRGFTRPGVSRSGSCNTEDVNHV